MLEFVLPRTDAGVLAQVVVAAILLVSANVYVRNRRREARVFIAGVTVLTIALLGLRALH